jgi:hypothetical protein
MKPNACTSLMCDGILNDNYCTECSHAIWFGEAEVNDKLWKWEFRKYFGPEFLNKDGSIKKRFPKEDHPVWDAFQKWYDENII